MYNLCHYEFYFATIIQAQIDNVQMGKLEKKKKAWKTSSFKDGNKQESNVFENEQWDDFNALVGHTMSAIHTKIAF